MTDKLREAAQAADQLEPFVHGLGKSIIKELKEALAQQDAHTQPASEADMAVYRGMAANYFKDAQQDAQALAEAIRAEPTEMIHKWRVLELIQAHAPTPPAQQDAQAVPQGGKLVPVEPTVWNSRKPGTGMPSGVQADDTVEWVNSTGISAISPHAQLLAWDGDYPVVRWRLVKREAPQPDTLNAAPTPPAQQDASAGLYHVAKARVEQPSEVRKLAHQFQCHPVSRGIDEIERGGELLIEQEDTIHQLQTMLHTSDTLRAKLGQERDELKRENDRLRGECTEWLCKRCRRIHPNQRRNSILQPCPNCGDAMMPTSLNRREIDRLQAERDELQAKLAREREARMTAQIRLGDEYERQKKIGYLFSLEKSRLIHQLEELLAAATAAEAALLYLGATVHADSLHTAIAKVKAKQDARAVDPLKLCPYTFRDRLCRYDGPATSCGKTFQACRAIGNEANFGGKP